MDNQTEYRNAGPGRFAIYRVKDDDIYKGLIHCPYERLIKSHRKAYVANYDKIYENDLLIKDTPIKILKKFSLRLPEDFKGHSLSVSDVIAVKQNGVQSAYYVDDMYGTKILIALPAFFTDDGMNDKITLSRGVEQHDASASEAHNSNEARTSIYEKMAANQDTVRQYHRGEPEVKRRGADMDR